MYGILALYGALMLVLVQFLILPVVLYFWDSKGLRRYPNMSRFAGVLNLPFMIASTRPHRSKDLLAVHQEKNAPALRIGPNHIAYSDVAAIKVNQDGSLRRRH